MTTGPTDATRESDELLAIYAQRGAASRWVELAERVMRMITPIVRNKVPPHDRDDVAQDALIRFYSALPSYSPQKGALRIFVSLLTRRQIADYYRSTRNAPNLVAIDEFADLIEDVAATVNPGIDTDALAAIAGADRWPIVLDWLDGYSWVEIANRHSITIGAAKMRRRAALDLLRTHLESSIA